MNKIFNSTLELIYPENLYCMCCGDLISKNRVHGLCDRCISAISWQSEDPFSKKDGFSFNETISLAGYDYNTRQILYDLKFHNKTYLARQMGGLMGELFASLHSSSYIFIPVPMFRNKQKIRGYNQAELLAKYASISSGNILIKDGLIKNKETDSMRMARADKRRVMLDGSININPKYKNMLTGADIALVDDVITTGSTAEHCSQVLKMAGVRDIVVLSFASVKKKENYQKGSII